MKILHVIDHMGLGGAQTLLRDLVEAQTENDNIFSFSLRIKNNHQMVNHKNNFSYQSNSIFSIKPLLFLKILISEYNIDVLHCHLLRSSIIGLVLKMIFYPKINLIFHEHGRIFQSNIIYSNFLRVSQKNVDCFIAVSQATKKRLIETGKIHESKINILYNYVNLDKFNKEKITWEIDVEKKILGISENKFVIGFAGRLIEWKGWFEFINSAKILNKNNNFIFLIAGDGPDNKKLSKLIVDLKLEENVFLLGYQSNMVKFYSLLDCLVVPSHWEPMGLTHIEAQAMGVPVIISDVPALNEIIHDKIDGLYFVVKNAEDLANKIKLLHSDILLREKIIINGLNNSKNYTLSKYQKCLDKIYKNHLKFEK